MKKAIVHIGNLKTGTTAIQAVLRVLRPDLAARGILMPGLSPQEPAHYAISVELGKPVEKARRLARILQDIEDAPEGSTLLITAETLMYVPAAWIRETLSERGVTDFQIICYLRPHISMLGSFYLQNLKNGIIHGPATRHLGMIGTAPMHFLKVVEDHGATFGPDRVVVREFHRSVLNDGSVVNDFWDMTALPEDLRARAIAIEQVSNPTPTAEIAMLLRACSNWLTAQLAPADREDTSREDIPPGQMRRANEVLLRCLNDRDDRLPGTQYRLPVVLQEAFNTHFEAARAAFAQSWFRTPASSGWLKEKVQPPGPLQDLPAAPVREALAEAIRRLAQQKLDVPAAGLASFRDRLPFDGTGGAEILRSAALAEIFGLEPDVDPPAAKLKNLMTPK